MYPDNSPEVEVRDSLVGRLLQRWAFLGAIVLGLATLASAWTSYEAVQWSNTASVHNRTAGTLRIESVAAADAANRNLTTDILLFSDWFQADVRGEDAIAAEIRARFRSEFAVAFDKWIGSGSADQLPVGTPFDSDYTPAAAREAGRLSAAAGEEVVEADLADGIANNYVRAAVLYASVLFLAGIASQISNQKSQRFTILLSIATLIAAIVFTAQQPVLL